MGFQINLEGKLIGLKVAVDGRTVACSLAALPAPVAALYAACAISAALFSILDCSTLYSPELRIAADAALLTPLLFLPVFLPVLR